MGSWPPQAPEKVGGQEATKAGRRRRNVMAGLASTASINIIFQRLPDATWSALDSGLRNTRATKTFRLS